MKVKIAPVDCRKDRRFRAAWRLALPTNLVSCLETPLLTHGITRLAGHRWISSLHWWLISWIPGSFNWPKCLLPRVSKIPLLLLPASLLLPIAFCFPLLLPGLRLHCKHLTTWRALWHKLHIHLTLAHLCINKM